MSELIKLLRNANRSSGRPTAGFGARTQEASRRKLVIIAEVGKPDVAAIQAAFDAGADVVQVELDASSAGGKLKELTEGAAGPVGVSFSGRVAADYDFAALEDSGVDYVKVEAGDVPASVFLLDGPAVVLELRDSFSDTMLKTINFLPARAVQVDSPQELAEFSIKQLMEKRVERELIGKPLLMKVGANVRPEAAQVLVLVAPNGLVVPASEVAAWKTAVTDLKEPSEGEEDTSSNISLKAPAA